MEQFERTISLIGIPAFLRLQAAHVAVIGLGGVGAACAEALARSGVGRITLMDHDTLACSNLNRQLLALHSTLGQQKAAVCAQRLLDINPDLKLTALPVFYGEDTRELLDVSALDAVADCVDTLSAKLLLAREARKHSVYLLSCMGAGNRLDASRLRFADIYQTSVCPLARRMRKACREAGIPALPVLYSTEEPIKAVTTEEKGRHAPGSVAFVPPVAGMMMAGEIIRRLIHR